MRQVLTTALKSTIASAALLATTGCMVPDQSGGYADPCELADQDGWTVSNHSSLEAKVGKDTINLWTRHLYYSNEPGMLMEINAYTFTGSKRNEIVLDPKTVSLVVKGKTYAPRDDIRESPFMQMHWQCGGHFDNPANLSKCGGGAVLTFNVQAPYHEGFVLRIGSLKVNGVTLQVPDIKYCYIPREVHWSRFHG